MKGRLVLGRGSIQLNPTYGCRGMITACFALIALFAWKDWFDSALRKLSVHPKYGRNGTVSRPSPLIALMVLIVLVALFHSTSGSAHELMARVA